MSEAKLTIDIQDGGAGRGDSPRPDSVDTDLLDRWKRLTDAMAKATDDVAAKSARRAASPPGGLTAGSSDRADRLAEREESRRVDAAEWRADRARRAADRAPEGERAGYEGAAAQAERVAQMERERTAKAAAARAERLEEAAAKADERDRERAERAADAAREKAERAADRAERMRERAEDAAADQSARRRAREEAKRQQDEEQNQKQAAADDAAKRRESHGRSLAGSAAGGAAGRYVGAAIGTAVAGPVGTVVGGVVGSVAGSYLGGKLGGTRDAGEDDKAGVPVGPVGQIQAVMDGTEKAFKFAGRAFEEAGRAAVKVAGNDGFGAAKQGAELAAQGLEEIPVVGKATAEGLRTLTKAFTAVKDAADAFAARGRELAGFNGNIAVAAAQQDVFRKLEDVREASQFGNGYADVIRAQTEFEATMRGLLEPVKALALDVLPRWLEKMTDFMIAVLEALNKLVPGTDFLQEMAEAAKEARRRARAMGGGASDLVGAWMFAPAVGPPMPPVPARGPDGRAPGGMGIPLVPGP